MRHRPSVCEILERSESFGGGRPHQSLTYTHTKHTSIESIECRTHLPGELLTKERESALAIPKASLSWRRCERRLTFLRRKKSPPIFPGTV